MEGYVILEMVRITKQMPRALANDRVDFSLLKGEIHALLGPNGAGKTTLMNILFGHLTPDKGHIFINGREVSIPNTRTADLLGIGMVHQHLTLCPTTTVLENVILGKEPRRWGIFLDTEKSKRRVQLAAEQCRIKVNLDTKVGELPLGVQQWVEIMRILYRGARIIVLDEPTANLTPEEALELFRVLRSLAEQGKAIIFITHKLKEVFAIADRITVLRNGRVVGTTTPHKTSEQELSVMMIGEEVGVPTNTRHAQPGNVVLGIKNLSVKGKQENTAIQTISLEVRGHEVFGILGIPGNGQNELVEALMGLRPVKGGQIHIGSIDTTHYSTRQVFELGVAYIPEDRQRDGLILSFPVIRNLVLNTYYLPPFARKLVVTVMSWRAVAGFAERLVKESGILTPSILALVSTLSGGNQQRLLLAREFSRPIQLLIACQPTRGLDVEATEITHQRILDRRDQGCAVLLITSDLDEVMALSDRIAVMYEGRVVAILPTKEASRQRLGLLMTGGRRDA